MTDQFMQFIYQEQPIKFYDMCEELINIHGQRYSISEPSYLGPLCHQSLGGWYAGYVRTNSIAVT